MSTNRKWLILPPAVALLLVLGPMSMKTEAAKGGVALDDRSAAAAPAAREPSSADAPLAVAAGEPAGSPATPGAGRPRTPTLPATPDLWQVGSTLLGVLLLGGVGVVVLRRLRQGPSSTGHGAIALRQSLRLGPKQTVYALEFDGRLLLVGEGERGLVLLHHTDAAEGDEREPAAAAPATPPVAAADDDGGAVPRNLVLPRPPVAPAQRPALRPARRAVLGDFRALLAKAGR